MGNQREERKAQRDLRNGMPVEPRKLRVWTFSSRLAKMRGIDRQRAMATRK